MSDVRKYPLSVEIIKNDAAEFAKITTTALENFISEYQFLYNDWQRIYKISMEISIENEGLKREIDQLKKQLEAQNE